MIKKLINFFKDEEGATMVEYGLMVALIAVVCIAGATLLGTAVNTKFTNVATASRTRPEAKNRRTKSEKADEFLPGRRGCNDG